MTPANVVALALLVALPLLAAAAVLGLRLRPALLGPAALAGLAAELILALRTATLSLSEPVAAAWTWGPRLTLQLEVAGLSQVMVALIPAIALPVVLYAWASLRSDPSLGRLLALLVAFTGAMELLIVAADFLTLLIGWELVGAISWALIAHEWQDATRPRAALQAFLTTRAGDLGLYAAAGLTLAASGSLQFTALTTVPQPALGLIAACVLLAAAAKSAQLPFSPWLFSAMAGPTPASALLHSATMVAAGAYAMARLWPAFESVGWFGPAVAALGLGTALAGGLVALLQRDAKRVLAASTSAQYGLMFVAVGAGVPAAAGLHLVAHAAFKALLFLGAGMLMHATGTGDLGRLRTAAARPRIAVAFGVGILALAAVPPLGGAYTKDLILAAAAERGPWLAFGVLLAGAMSALYAGRLYLLAIGVRRDAANAPSPYWERAAMAALAALGLALGVLWIPGAASAAADLVGGRLARSAGWELPASLLAIALAAAAAW
ncbi:MAG: proton-conducting transporter membrane subunit, partial [Gemmatimonadales bacterium]